MLPNPTVERLNELRLYGMAAALAEQQSQDSVAQLGFEERLGVLGQSTLSRPRICRGDMSILGLTPSGLGRSAPGRPSRIKDTPQFFGSTLAKIGSCPTSSQ